MHITAVLAMLALLAVHPIDGGFREDMLDEHNRFRKMHGVSDLKLDNNLCTIAEENATSIVSVANPQFDEEDVDYNWCCVPNNPLECVQKWYDTIKYHNFDKNEFEDEATPFIYIVWRRFKFFGVGQATANTIRGMQTCVVARYDLDDGLEENLPKPISAEPSTTPSTSSSSKIWRSLQCFALVTFSWLALYLLN